MGRTSDNPFNMNNHMFMEDFCGSYSISFSPRDSIDVPYYVFDNNNLEELFTYCDCSYFRYTFDKVLTDITRNMISNGVAYLEIIEKKDNQEKLVGLNLHVLDSTLVKDGFNLFVINEISSTGKKKRKIHKENIVVFKLSDLGISKYRVRRILKRIDKVNLPNTDLTLNSNIGFNWDKYKESYDYKQLSVGKELYWYFRNSNNPLFSECYLLYRIAKFDELRQLFFQYIMYKINDRLSILGDKYGFSGVIKQSWGIIDYSKCLELLSSGEYNTSQAGDIIISKQISQ